MWYIWHIWSTINDGKSTYSLSTRNPNVSTENSWYWWCSLANRKSSLTLLVVEVSKPVHTTSDGLLHTALWLVLLRPGTGGLEAGWRSAVAGVSVLIGVLFNVKQQLRQSVEWEEPRTDDQVNIYAPFDVTISFNCLVLNTCIMIEDSVYRYIFILQD